MIFCKNKFKNIISLFFIGFLPLNVFAGVIFTSEENGTHESQFFIDSGDVAADFIDLEFGTSNTAKLRFDIVNDNFELNKNLNLQNKTLENTRIENLAVASVCNGTVIGKIYFNITDNNSYICDGFSWDQINNYSNTEIKDANNDTKIQVEESADEDIIRFDTFGVERMKILSDGEVNIAGSVLRFNRGKGNVVDGSDISFNLQGLISSESNMLFNIDSDNSSITEKFAWNKDADGMTGAVEIMTLTEDGDLDVSDQIAVGKNAVITGNQVFKLSENYNVDANSYQLYNPSIINSPILTADRTSYGSSVSLTNNKTEDLVGGFDSDAIAVHGFTQTTGTNTFRTNRGGFFEARNSSTATSDLGSVNGVLAIGRQYSDNDLSDMNSVVGVQGQGIGYTGASATAGDITTAYGVYGTAYPYKSDIQYAYGTYGYTATNNTYTGNIANAYGIRGHVRVDSNAGGDITNGYGGYFATTKRVGANNMATATGLYSSATSGNINYAGKFFANTVDGVTNYGLYIDSKNATGDNYGIYGIDGDWVLDANGDGISGGTGAGGDLIIGETQELKLYFDGSNAQISTKTGDLYVGGTTGTNDVILSNNGGNVGIGNPNPTSKLSVVGLPSGATDSVTAGTLSGAVCITTTGNMYIDTGGICAN